MAITSLKHRYNMNGLEYAYTTVDHSVIDAGSSIPLFVPAIMPNISSGEPKITSKVTKGATVFKNAPACRPAVNRIVRTQNYLSPSFSRNQSWEGISKKRGHEEYIPRKSMVLCTSVSSSPKKMTFGTDPI